MSQNDMSLANANGATFRADVNSALQALASNNGGSSAPSTAYANQWWFDTSSDILKIRDEANANWVNVASLVGTTWIPYSNGSVLGTLANQNASGISANLALSAKHIAFATTAVSSGTPDFATSGNVVSLSSTATGVASMAVPSAPKRWKNTSPPATNAITNGNAMTIVSPCGRRPR